MDFGRNRLGDEKSPYLLQHKDNPVWWQPWGRAALDEAARRNVPVFLSIGYSTCHWCHVMEHESFEDAEVARALNEGFVAVKVDREERPDVDAIYMDAVQATTGRGGWPMSVFMAPDGRPFFAGTYFPRDHFLHLLGQIGRAWREQRPDIETVGAEIANALANATRRERAGNLDAGLLRLFVGQVGSQFDPRCGGRRGAPKFPPAYELQLLLRIHRRGGDERALAMAERTLDAMAAGGIYDHLGGGFHRYATDERWLVPHFEKMLYDQASLAGAYLDAWLATGRAEYERVVRETLDYVLRDLTSPDGGFLCAEDADSEGEEGRFYVWTPADLERVLSPDEALAVRAAFGVTPAGNFEHGTSILELQPGHARTTRPPLLERAMAALFTARSARVRPHLDDKVLADWNGLMIASMARAGRALGEPRYVEGARRAAGFVLDRMRDPGGRLLHRYRDGQAAVPGFLDDHAFLVHGLCELYQSTFDPGALTAAEDLQAAQDALFWDAERSDYFATDGQDRTVIVRRADFWDNVTPAGRSVAAFNLLRLAALCGRPEHRDRAARVFASTPAEVRRSPAVFAFLLAALDFALDRAKEIAVVGPPGRPDTQALLTALARAYLPNAVVACGDAGLTYPALLAGRTMDGGVATAYVCEHGVCRRPAVAADELLAAAGEPARLD